MIDSITLTQIPTLKDVAPKADMRCDVSGCLYKLYHHYDMGDHSVYFSFANSELFAVDLAVYLQIKAERLFHHSICLEHSTILKFLTHFGAKEYNGQRQYCRKIDMYSDRECPTKEWYGCTFSKLDKVYGEMAVAFLKVDPATVTQAKAYLPFQDRSLSNET